MASRTQVVMLALFALGSVVQAQRVDLCELASKPAHFNLKTVEVRGEIAKGLIDQNDSLVVLDCLNAKDKLIELLLDPSAPKSKSDQDTGRRSATHCLGPPQK